MKLIKWLVGVALIAWLMSVFMLNKDVELQVNYWGLAAPLRVAFWELVTFCVSLGIIIAAVSDSIARWKMTRERRRLIQTDKEQRTEIDRLNSLVSSLESENRQMKSRLENQTGGIPDLTSTDQTSAQLEPAASELTIDKPEDYVEKK